jgi:peptidoglycan hydrolase CwlO-like protein
MISWKWLVGTLLTLLLISAGSIYSNLREKDAEARAQLDKHQEEISTLHQNYGRIEERLNYMNRSLDDIKEAINSLTIIPSFPQRKR